MKWKYRVVTAPGKKFKNQFAGKGLWFYLYFGWHNFDPEIFYDNFLDAYKQIEKWTFKPQVVK